MIITHVQEQIRYASLPQAMENLSGKPIGSKVIAGRQRYMIIRTSADGASDDDRALMALFLDEPWPTIDDLQRLNLC